MADREPHVQLNPEGTFLLAYKVWDLPYLGGLPNLVSVDASTCALKASTVDRLFIELSANGGRNGEVKIAGSEAPTEASAAVRDSLAAKGWVSDTKGDKPEPETFDGIEIL